LKLNEFSFIYSVDFQIILTRNYSNFICTQCHQNLQQLVAFRRKINEKQQKLTQFLCRIDDQNDFPAMFIPEVKIEPKFDAFNFSTVVIKTEVFDEDSTRGYSEESRESFDNFEDEFKPPVKKPRKEKGETTKPKESTETSSEDPFITCHICGKVLRRNSLHNHNRRVHNNERNFFCDYCGKGFYLKGILLDHIVTHLPKHIRGKSIKCSQCPKLFTTPGTLRFHFKDVHAEVLSTCEECGKTFTSRNLFKQHRKTDHKEKIVKICDICGETFAEPVKLRDHILLEHTEGRGSFLCNLCGKRFNLPRHLKSHAITHMERKFACEVPGCGKKFPSAIILRTHTKQHFDKKKCPIPGCNKQYPTNHKLSRHIGIFHEKIRENCPVDGCSFKVGRRQ
jgi:uncharacterized Zn-finger protein